ncbi:MAG: tetratricopeptide repeat protein, partial [Myxococcota bacterium]
CRDLGLLYVEQGQLPTAEYVYREGLERLQEIGLEDDLMAADLHYYLAELALEQGNNLQAERQYLKARDIYEVTGGRDGLKMAKTLHGLARALAAKEQWSRAQAHVERALEIYAQRVEPSNPRISGARTLREEARARVARGSTNGRR